MNVSSSEKAKGDSAINQFYRSIMLYRQIYHASLRKGAALGCSLCWLVLFCVLTAGNGVGGEGRAGIPQLPSPLRARSLPSSLTAAPTLALAPPGTCQFSKQFAEVRLLRRWQVSPTSHVLRFGLPDPAAPLNLSTCACLLAKGVPSSAAADGAEAVVRPYTPISTNAQVGSFDLLVKDYGDGTLSHRLCRTTRVGDAVPFAHVPANVKAQAPFGVGTVAMIAGGTGITPMIQAAHAVLGDPAGTTRVVLLYSSRTADDVLGRELLDAWARRHPERFRVEYTLTREPAAASSRGWRGYSRGRISRAMVEAHVPKEDVLVFVCGPESMYETFSGPRGEEELGGLLADMGYSSEQVYKF